MKDRTPLKIIAIIVIPILLAVTIRFIDFGSGSSPDQKKEKPDTEQVSLPESDSSVKVITKWMLPDILQEVSGIAWLSANRFACVQDELGKVFIYDTAKNKIEREIQFGPPGDYEGVAVADQSIFVLRADGVLFGIGDYTRDNPPIESFKTHLTKKEDSESLAYDSKHHRLLVGVKAADPGSDEYKGIYSYDLRTKKMSETPVYKINLKDKLLEKYVKKKLQNAISPSDIEIHPVSGDIFVLEGTKPKLMIMGTDGIVKNVFDLKKSVFPQPEGLSFSPEGKLYISSEGGKGPGIILEVALNDGI